MSDSLDKDAAVKLLKDHMVVISRNLNTIALKPYLIQNGCVTMEESKQFHEGSSRPESNFKLIDIISQRGVSAFNGFMKSLEQFTTDETEEGAHKELLDELRSAESATKIARRQRPSVSSYRTQSSKLSLVSSSGASVDPTQSLPLVPPPSIPELAETTRCPPSGDDEVDKVRLKPIMLPPEPHEQTPEDDDHNISEEIDIQMMPEVRRLI